MTYDYIREGLHRRIKDWELWELLASRMPGTGSEVSVLETYDRIGRVPSVDSTAGILPVPKS